ncbi:hypothetical protein HPP92_001860 [Vanilla planifolia]|uniref:Amine oxidase n=1 Tax=Vanilla planifolia TaxID=51239 RepID=A0A835VLY7_VANPL|nr:hypothetical protein HPP92_001860 [Vanilla planifolia]
MVTCMPPMYHPILSTLSPSARSPPFTPSQPPTLLLPPHHFPAIHSLSLLEPPKSAVLSWLKNTATSSLPPRLASIITSSPNLTHLITVDKQARRVLVHNSSPTRPHSPADHLRYRTRLLRCPSHPPFARAIRSRGLDPLSVFCIPLSPCWFGPAEENRRLAKVQCYAIGPNLYMRPLEGLTALVDVDTARVVWIRDVEQDNVPPVPSGEGTDYRYRPGRGRPHGCRLRGLEEGRDSRWRAT